MKLGAGAVGLGVALFLPLGGRELGGVFGQHVGQAGQYVCQVFFGVDAKATTVLYDGVEDGAFLPGFFATDEQPVFGAELGRSDRVFYEIVAYFHAPIAEVGLEVGPLVDGVAESFAELAFGQDAGPKGQAVDEFFEALMDGATLGGSNGLAQGGTVTVLAQAFFDVVEVGELAQDPGDEAGGLFGGFKKFPSNVGVAAHEFDPGFVACPGGVDAVAVALDDVEEREVLGGDGLGVLGGGEEAVHAFGVAAGMPVAEDAAAGDAGGPEVAGFGFAVAGLEVFDGGFVDLAVEGAPVFGLDVTVDDGEPVGGEEGPVTEGFAVEIYAHAGKDFGLAVVGKMAWVLAAYYAASVDDFGDEAGGGDAAVLEGGGQCCDGGLGEGIVFANVFAAHELEAEELGGLVVELFADFFADAAVVLGVELDFEGIEFFAYEGEVLGDAGGAGFGGTLFVFFDVSRRSGVCGSGGLGLFWVVAFEEEEELGGVEFFALGSEDATGESVDGLPEYEDLGGLALDDVE